MRFMFKSKQKTYHIFLSVDWVHIYLSFRSNIINCYIKAVNRATPTQAHAPIKIIKYGLAIIEIERNLVSIIKCFFVV